MGHQKSALDERFGFEAGAWLHVELIGNEDLNDVSDSEMSDWNEELNFDEDMENELAGMAGARPDPPDLFNQFLPATMTRPSVERRRDST